MGRFILPVLFGVVGCAILLALGGWQVQRLTWKNEILSDLRSAITAAPVAVPASATPDMRYLPVHLAGRLTGAELHILASIKDQGAVYRIIAAVESEAGRRVMVDLGTVPTTAKDVARAGTVAVTGNLHWPEETDGFTPEPDLPKNIWFARDVATMAAALNTEPVLIVARNIDPPLPGVTPLPVGTEGIPNDHLQYAITWFSLAAIWAGMTGYFLWRMRRTEQEG